MSTLTKKLIRDLWRMRWQYVAVATMLILGVTFYGAATMSYRNLSASYDHSYDRLGFEDIGMTFQPAPERVVRRIEKIPGVVAVEGRLVQDVIIELPNSSTSKLIGRLISLPVNRPPSVNNLKVEQGSYISGRNEREVLLEKSFADNHNLKPGDHLEITEGTTNIKLRITGIAVSPEYVYVVRSKQDLMPMPETFGVMFVSEDVLGPLVSRTGQVNEVRVRLAPDADLDRVSREMQRTLGTYNPDEPIPREEQPSHQLLQQDIDGFRVYAVLFPLLFFSVSALTVYTLLTRTVHLQRGVIGLLRALGFGQGRVVLHYLMAALLVGLISGVLGAALGLWLGNITSDWYISFISVAYTKYTSQSDVGLISVALSCIVCIIAGVIPARNAARIKPAEAMRGIQTTVGRVVTLDKLLPRLRLLWRIPLRNVFRQTKRTLSTLFGIVAGIALIMIGQGMLDSTNEIMDMMLGSMFSDDLRAEFIEPQDGDIIEHVRQMDGVVWAEGRLDVPVDFVKDSVTYSALLSGLDQASRSHELRSPEEALIKLDGEGVVLGRTIKKRLDLETGDLVEVTLPAQYTEEPPKTRTVRVLGFVNEPVGTVAYSTREHVWRLFRQDLKLTNDAVTGVVIQADPIYETEIKARLLDIPEIAAVSAASDAREMIDEMMGQFKRFILVMLIFGSALAFSIVFNTVTINVLERTNEVATMRTLGVSRLQVAWMVSLENIVLGLIGVAVGLPIGRWFVGYFVTAAQTEEQADLFTFDITIYPATYILTAGLILTVVLLSQIPALFYLNRLDLARATKERSS